MFWGIVVVRLVLGCLVVVWRGGGCFKVWFVFWFGVLVSWCVVAVCLLGVERVVVLLLSWYGLALLC